MAERESWAVPKSSQMIEKLYPWYIYPLQIRNAESQRERHIHTHTSFAGIKVSRTIARKTTTALVDFASSLTAESLTD